MELLVESKLIEMKAFCKFLFLRNPDSLQHLEILLLLDMLPNFNSNLVTNFKMELFNLEFLSSTDSLLYYSISSIFVLHFMLTTIIDCYETALLALYFSNIINV